MLKSVKELVRVSSKLVVIIEPSYEFSTEASKANVFNKGYTRINDDHFRKIGLKPLFSSFSLETI